MNGIARWIGDWIDDRTGYKQLVHEALYENVPGGSRWIYVTGSMLVFAFVTQTITGLFLWMCYSAGSQNAWESVYWIQHEMQGGWLLRGVHHFMAQGMVVLLPLHLLQVVLCKAYVKPREVNYWLGLVLLLLVLALGLTGYLLPWDQKGYWATKVATELMSLPPGGAYIQRLVVGGSEYGHFTLARFFALHAGVLPILLVLVLALHVAMFRRHGITARSSARRPDEFFWPEQVFKDAVACLVLLAVVVGVVCWKRGAELGPPAEPTEFYGAARPEWYYLFLFQMLKKFHSEFVGAIVVPGLVMAFLFLLPIIAKVRFGHVVNVVVILALLGGIVYLTFEAIDHDNYARWHTEPPQGQAAGELHAERTKASRDYLSAREHAEHEYERVRQLVAFYGIPKEGAASGLVSNDPEIMGPRIFKRACASCHSYLDADGQGIAGPEPPRDKDGKPLADPEPYGAPNLFGIGSRNWFQRILDPGKIASPDVFGATRHQSGEMVEFVQNNLGELDDEKQKSLAALIAALSAEAKLPGQVELDEQAKQDGTIDAGKKALSRSFGDAACTDCHKYHDEGSLGTAPDLTGYGSAQWLTEFIANPKSERFYLDEDGNDRMPAFAEHPAEPQMNLLTNHEIEMLVRWLRDDDKDLRLKLELQAAASRQVPTEPPVSAEPTPAVTTRDDEPAGARLFRRHCSRCHAHLDPEGNGIAGPKPREEGDPNGAPDLHGFASRSWLAGLLDPQRVDSNEYFGNTAHKAGDMVDFVQTTFGELDDDGKTALAALIAALSAEAKLPQQSELDATAEGDGTLESGREAIVSTFACIDCHKFHDDGELGAAPDLTAYGSKEWLVALISNPEHERFYDGNNDRMPAFAASPDPSEANRLSPEELETIALWLRGEPPP